MAAVRLNKNAVGNVFRSVVLLLVKYVGAEEANDPSSGVVRREKKNVGQKPRRSVTAKAVKRAEAKERAAVVSGGHTI